MGGQLFDRDAEEGAAGSFARNKRQNMINT